jgi:glucose/arabinose dehydrogenase
MINFSLVTAGLILSLQPLIEKGIQDPVSIAFEKNKPSQMLVVEQRGRILVFENGAIQKEPFLDIENKVEFGGEKGLLGLALHPNFSQNGRYFINYTTRNPKLTTVISERNRRNKSEKILLSFKQPYANHNGGHLAFGPDEKLYVSTGDGGSGGDPLNQGQNQDSFLGKILRIDVDQIQFPIQDPKSVIFAWGLRNPWRFSFDRKTGALFAGDVGQNQWEEIDLIEAGKNYGWKVMEGFHCFEPKKNCKQNGLELPLVEYGRELGGSVTGGYVYRGKKIPQLQGTYLYGDFMSGNIWGLVFDQTTRKVIRNEILLKSKRPISSFGEDPSGELYLVDYSGKILKLVGN